MLQTIYKRKENNKMKKRRLSTRIVSILLVMVLAVNQEVIMQRDFMPDVVTETISLDKEESTVVVKAASTKKQKIAAYNKKAKKAYKKFLKKVKKQTKKEDMSYCKGEYPVFYDQAQYSFSDINNDGKLELILHPGEGTGVGDDLYVYKNGKVKYIGTVGGIYTVYKSGNMFYSTLGTGYWNKSWYRFRNGKLTCVASCSFNNDKIDSKSCEINGKSVSAKKMKNWMKKMEKKKTVQKSSISGALKDL